MAAFIEEMNAARAECRMTGGAMHGFTHRTGPPSPGVAYAAAADAGSFAAIMTFLTEIFGGRLAVG